MANIRTYSLILGICCCLFSCGNQDFSISGHLEQGKDNCLFIDEINPDGIAVLDTLLLINGNFSYRIRSKEEGLYRIRLDDTTFVPFMGGRHDKLVFSGNANNLTHSYRISGNESSEILWEVQQQINDMYRLTDSLSKLFIQAQKEERLDSITPLLDSCYFTNFQSCRSYLRNIIDNHLGELVTLPLFYQRIGTRNFFSEKNDAELFMNICQQLLKKHPDNKHVRALQEKYGLK